jgi:hypothetical protein
MAPLHCGLRVELRKVLADDLVRRVALYVLGTGVPRQHAALRVEHEDRVVLDAFHEQAKSIIGWHLETLRKVTWGIGHGRVTLDFFDMRIVDANFQRSN